jgi:Ser-tRNA(Ala) deacylase AlaX
MTEKIFWTDPYLTTLTTRVASVAAADVMLERTIFYALSGGQESDHGTIGGRSVLAARKDGAEIVYALPDGHGLRPGETVEVAIDWPRRYRLMRLHFAAEIVLELAYEMLPGIAKIGAHIASDKARIDFAWAENIAGQFPGFSARLREIVERDAAILSAFSDRAAGRRYWEIPGFARVPCGGTHLRRTGEIGAVALKRKNIGKGKERIEIHVDDRPA